MPKPLSASQKYYLRLARQHLVAAEGSVATAELFIHHLDADTPLREGLKGDLMMVLDTICKAQHLVMAAITEPEETTNGNRTQSGVEDDNF